MLANPHEAMAVSEIYNVPPEDILFLDLNLSGARFHLPYSRIRFEFLPEYRPYFRISMERNIKKYFFPLPTSQSSNYYIEDDYLKMNREILGKVKGTTEDTCDSSYSRRNGTVLNLNPNSKSLCHGCKFCHTIQQTARDGTCLFTSSEFRLFLKKWIQENFLPDLSNLIQVALITGCFGSENKVVKYLKIIKKVLNEYKFNGELLYYGSEIVSNKALDELKEVEPFALCLSLECFENRDTMLRDTKRNISIENARNILSRAKENGFKSNFSYILGIESLESMEKLFKGIYSFINRFPIINVFQIHRGQEKLRHPDAWKIEYYMKARKMLENLFVETDMRPRPWENYRGLWYLQFGESILDGIRTP